MGILDKIFGRSGNVDEDKLALFVNLLMTLAEVDGNFSEDEGKHITKYIQRPSHWVLMVLKWRKDSLKMRKLNC